MRAECVCVVFLLQTRPRALYTLPPSVLSSVSWPPPSIMHPLRKSIVWLVYPDEAPVFLALILRSCHLSLLLPSSSHGALFEPVPGLDHCQPAHCHTAVAARCAHLGNVSLLRTLASYFHHPLFFLILLHLHLSAFAHQRSRLGIHHR